MTVKADSNTVSMPRSPSGSIARRGPSDGVCRRPRLPPRSRRAAPRRFAARCRAARGLALLSSLHLEDLALACACALGDAAAWDHFVLEMRPGLYRAADALDPTGAARELADSLYADLYGVDQRGRRASVAVALLSRPQQPRHVAACRARAAPCRSRACRPPHRAAAGGDGRATRRPRPPTPSAVASSTCCARRSRARWPARAARPVASSLLLRAAADAGPDRHVAERARGDHVAAARAHATGDT